MHLVFMATVSQTGHQGWYEIRVLPPSGEMGWRATSALAAPTRAKRKVVVCTGAGSSGQPSSLLLSSLILSVSLPPPPLSHMTSRAVLS